MYMSAFMFMVQWFIYVNEILIWQIRLIVPSKIYEKKYANLVKLR